ncbi:YggT family protein [Rothia sp. P6271]|uniref:YggT family protein n=1 Tax=unclassified Rothia (in: high G+C Gram-positive bacteria) TaxID=2689056 RepID=UPI003AD0A3B8
MVGYLLALLNILVFTLYFALLLRLVFDWVQMFSRFWRPQGVFLVVASAVYAITDPPLNALRRLVPPLRVGGMSLDLGFLILIFAIMIINNFLFRLIFMFS